MKRYFVEYEFKTPYENIYWFPLYIMCKNMGESKVASKTVSTAIKQHYELIRITGPKLSSDATQEYINQRLKGRLAMLEMNVWRINDIPTNPELNFDQHLELVVHEGEISEKIIAEIIKSRKYPVKLYYSGSDLNVEDFLLINVVDPTNIEEVYIIVEIDPADAVYKTINMLNEGIWKDSHLSGYKVRVDAPHTPDGKRHVHIAHPKHVNSKDKQVSWNADKTRHDKKSFDTNFVGLEKAKEIARKELGLDNNAILEAKESDINILLENVLDGRETDHIIFLSIEIK